MARMYLEVQCFFISPLKILRPMKASLGDLPNRRLGTRDYLVNTHVAKNNYTPSQHFLFLLLVASLILLVPEISFCGETKKTPENIELQTERIVILNPFVNPSGTHHIYLPRSPIAEITNLARDKTAQEIQTAGEKIEKTAKDSLERLQVISKDQAEEKGKLMEALAKEEALAKRKDPQKIEDLKQKINAYNQRLHEANPFIRNILERDVASGRSLQEQAKNQIDSLKRADGSPGSTTTTFKTNDNIKSQSQPNANKTLPPNSSWEVIEKAGETRVAFEDNGNIFSAGDPEKYQKLVNAWRENPTAENTAALMKQTSDLSYFNPKTNTWEQGVGALDSGGKVAFGTPGQTPSSVWDNGSGKGGSGQTHVRNFDPGNGSTPNDYEWFRLKYQSKVVEKLSPVDALRTQFPSETAALAQARKTFGDGGAVGEYVRLQLPTTGDQNYYIVPRSNSAQPGRGITSNRPQACNKEKTRCLTVVE